MDTSETYIKMCETALKIQELRQEEKHQDTGRWQAGDFWTTVFDSDKGHIFVVCDVRDAWDDEPHYLHHPIECIWLPRQDQLQGMLGEPLWQLNFKFIDWLCDEPYDGHIRHAHLDFKSMEQLWLAFYMKEKYNKVWDGEDWIEKI